MTKISEMLLTKGTTPDGNLEAARKAVEAYHKIINEHPEVHNHYAADECIGYISGDKPETYEYMSLHMPFHLSPNGTIEIGRVYFDKEAVTISQLEYFLKQEGLHVEEVNTYSWKPTEYRIRVGEKS